LFDIRPSDAWLVVEFVIPVLETVRKSGASSLAEVANAPQ
jgi:hypothetical protein